MRHVAKDVQRAFVQVSSFLGTSLLLLGGTSAQAFIPDGEFFMHEGMFFCEALRSQGYNREYIGGILVLTSQRYESQGLTTDGIRLAIDVIDRALYRTCPDQQNTWFGFVNWLQNQADNNRYEQGAQRIATLQASPGSRVNLRDWPSMEASARPVGRPGDRVTVWEERSVDGYMWYKVAILGANTVGWVRGDVINLPDHPPYVASYTAASNQSSYGTGGRVPMGTGYLLGSYSDRINLRDWPSMEASARPVGRPGNQVTIWGQQVVDGYVWYRVAIRGSNTTGWVRGDVINLTR